MKNIIFLLFVFFIGCVSCIDYPTRLVDKKGIPLEPASCYDYRVCLYNTAVVKGTSDCALQFTKCCKERNYIFCNNPKKRWEGTKPQECWDKLD